MAIATGIGAGLAGLGGIIGAVSGARNGGMGQIEANQNPWTKGVMSQLQGLQGMSLQNILAGQAGYNLPDLQGNMQALQGIMPGLMQFREDIMGPYGSQLQNTANLQMQQNFRDVGAQYGNMGAANSGSAISAMTRGAALPYAQAMQQLGQTSVGVGSGLLQGAQQQQMNLNQMGLQRYLGDQGLWGNTLGQTIGAMGSIANPGAMPQDSYYQNNQGSPWGNFFSGFGGLLMGAGGMGAGSGASTGGWSGQYYQPGTGTGMNPYF